MTHACHNLILDGRYLAHCTIAIINFHSTNKNDQNGLVLAIIQDGNMTIFWQFMSFLGLNEWSFNMDHCRLKVKSNISSNLIMACININRNWLEPWPRMMSHITRTQVKNTYTHRHTHTQRGRDIYRESVCERKGQTDRHHTWTYIYTVYICVHLHIHHTPHTSGKFDVPHFFDMSSVIRSSS